MSSPASPRQTHSARILGAAGVISAAAVLAACGSSSKTAAGSARAASSTGSPAASSAPPGITIGSRSIPGFGTVLVDGSGRTLYMLTSEQGGKITCTDENGCTRAWPDTELPKGVSAATAGPGVQASLLGTVKDAAGSLHVTYDGWPLHTFARDSAPGQARGEGITSFGGTWYVLAVSGQPVKSASNTGTSGNGYSY